MQARPRSPRRRITGTLSALLLAGCTTLGPDYSEPTIDWLANWQPQLYPSATTRQTTDAPDLATWWQVLADPALDRLVVIALADNPGMRIAALRILESRALLGIAGSNRYPQYQQLSGGINRIESEQHGGTVRDRSQATTAWQGAVEAGWEIDFWGRFTRAIESADATLLASIDSQHDAQVLLTSQLADLYYAYRTTQIRIGKTRENIARQRRSLEITERIFDSGQGSELDFQQARTQFLATSAALPDLELARQQLRHAIATLLGRAPDNVPELDSEPAALPETTALALQEQPAELLLRRPDLRAAAWQVAAQSAQLGIATADYYPSISLVGSLGWSGASGSDAPVASSIQGGSVLRWNLFDHGRIAGNIRLQDARLQQRIEHFQQVALLAAQEIEDAAASIRLTREQIELLAGATAAARRSLELAMVRYQEGYADFQRVLDAQRTLLTQEEREVVARGAHVSAVILLYKALGGGWKATAIDQMLPPATRAQMQQRTDWGDVIEEALPAAPPPAAR